MGTKHPPTSRENELRLPGAELDVLACLWRLGQATARELRGELRDLRPMTHGSVGTLLSRLEVKSLVRKEKGPVGKAFIFHPTRQRATGYNQVAAGMLRRVFGGNSVAFVTSLLETKPPTAEELKALHELLDRLGKDQGR